MDLEELLNEETKACPACAEMIKLKAKKCRFCEEMLDPDEVAKQIEDRRAELTLAKQKEGKVQCPQCGTWDVRWATIEDGGMGHWCGICNKSLKAMGADVPPRPGRPIPTQKPSEDTKVIIEQKSSGVWAFVGVLLAIVLILVILGMLGI